MKTIQVCKVLILAGLINLSFNNFIDSDGEKPLIFPIPLETKISEGSFTVDQSVVILLPSNQSKNDDFLAGLLHNELADKFGHAVPIEKRPEIRDNDKFILAGDLSNPLIKNYCEQNGLISTLKELGDEGYILMVKDMSVVIAGNSNKGALYGLESLRQLIIRNEAGNITIPCLIVKDTPQFPFRGIKLYLPGRENITFFKRFISDFAALYKFNKIILELNANMRLERHPELNRGAVEFYRYLNFSRLDRPPGKHMEFQNSSHQDNADGGILEKEEVADLVNYMRKFNIEVIPELPSLTHSYYLLAGHNDLAENPEQPFPDTYCPLRPESYKIYFDVLDEYIEVIQPAIIHIGHDEWRMEKNLCPLCKGRDYGQLYADDVIKIHDYLAKKGIKTALWGDHLLESVTKKDHQEWKSSTGYKYNIPGALTPEQVIKLIPKDIIVFNWFWSNIDNDLQVSDFGFNQVYGNFTPDINKWNERVITRGLMGGAPSSWAATTEKNFGKDLIYDFLGTSNLLWSKHYITENKLALITQSLTGEIRGHLSGKMLPGDIGINIKPLNISAQFNSSLNRGLDSLGNSSLLPESVMNGNIIFNLNSSTDKEKRAITVTTQKIAAKPSSVNGIEINKDVNSLIFLHACAKPGRNGKAYRMIYNFDETAELLGWYEVVYDDGFIETIPIRYGVNILDWTWYTRVTSGEKISRGSEIQRYVYNARAITCSEKNSTPVTFFSFEWENTRPGIKISSVNMKSVRYNKNNENAITLFALTISDNTQKAAAEGTENE